MASIKLPYPQEQSSNTKETVDNLYDTVLKLRKELEYALLNLDSDNIPGLNSIVGSIDDAYTMIEQTSEGISLVAASVTNLSEGLASAQSSIDLNAENILLKVSSTDYTGENLVSMINVSSSKISASAVDISLSGLVTFSTLENTLVDGTTTISGDNITTGTITGTKFRTANSGKRVEIGIEGNEYLTFQSDTQLYTKFYPTSTGFKMWSAYDWLIQSSQGVKMSAPYYKIDNGTGTYENIATKEWVNTQALNTEITLVFG